MPRLIITYGDKVIHDADVEEFTWTDAPGAVQVTGKTKRTGGSGLFDLLTSARKGQGAETKEVVA